VVDEDNGTLLGEVKDPKGAHGTAIVGCGEPSRMTTASGCLAPIMGCAYRQA